MILYLVMSFFNCLTIKSILADWWERFGDDVPVLQKFAIRILSLTTSASGCERNWSTFEQVRKVTQLTTYNLHKLNILYFEK